MPARIKYTREAILDAAFALVRAEGMEKLNARNLAARLSCSTQPIFRTFSGMEEIRQELSRRAYECYQDAILYSASLSADKPYLGTGLAYLHFAKEEPQLFRLLFMSDLQSQNKSQPLEDPSMGYVLDTICASTGMTREDARQFHTMLFMFTHGLAVQIATGFADYTHEQMVNLLSEQFHAMRAYYAAKSRKEASDEQA